MPLYKLIFSERMGITKRGAKIHEIECESDSVYKAEQKAKRQHPKWKFIGWQKKVNGKWK